jgi:hypothetical protein
MNRKIVLFLSLVIPVSLYGQDKVINDTVPIKAKQPVYVTTRLVTPRPVIDGKLDDECWKKGTWAGSYNQFIPNEGAKPSYPTEMNIQYDDKSLYIAFRAYDGEPENIVRMAGTRDQLVGDVMGITFDSYRDYRTGFEFNITAWGQKVDAILFNPMNSDVNWNAVWKCKVSSEDSAWVAEYEIPLSQLRYTGKDEQVWGLHTWRWISRYSEESNWEHQSVTGPGMLYNFGELKGISGLKKSRRLEVLPYTLGGLKAVEKEPGNPFVGDGRLWNANLGFDAKIGVSSNFTVDLTVNPDFGQVESDPSVMNLSAFETFYEEKRPFFLEGLTIFDYQFDRGSLFYSRRIGHAPSLAINPSGDMYVNSPEKTTILSAVKFSGTTSDGLSLGLIQSITANQKAKISDFEGNRSKMDVEPLTSYTVARIQKGYNAGNTIAGAMLTSTNRIIDAPALDFLSHDAYTGGIDLLHYWKDKEFFVDARLTGSYIDGSKESIRRLQENSAHYFQKPGSSYLPYDTAATTMSGFGGRVQVGKGSKGFWKYNAALTWSSPGLDLNDLGYMQSADFIKEDNEVSYLINQPAWIFHSYTVSFEQFNSWNFNGRYLGSGGHMSFNSKFKNNWNFDANVIYNTSQIDPQLLRGGPDMMVPNSVTAFGGASTDDSKNVVGRMEVEYNKRGNNSWQSWAIQPGLSVRPMSTVKIDISADYSKNNDDLQYVATIGTPGERNYILGNIDQQTLGLTLRVDLNFTPEFSIQYYGSPFISKGEYSEFKYVTRPEAPDYGDRFSVFANAEKNPGELILDPGNPSLTTYNPDFNFFQFRSNLVAKWEYRLGSFIYLVWSSERTGSSVPDSFGDSFKTLRKAFPNNIFMVKLNYWFNL